jgi:5-formyltetrahydrofolate cyclo-ligase
VTHDEGTNDARTAKSQFRIQAGARIHSMTPDERSSADHKICGYLCELADRLEVSSVLAYLALPDEVRVDEFLAAMVEKGRATLLPRIVGNGSLRYGNWRPVTRLSRDREGVLAPQSASIDGWTNGSRMMVLPGRVFDATGGRVGRGRGYFDRLLGKDGGRGLVVGAAYECQVVERVPREGHDRDVDCLITETGCRRFRAGPTRTGN